MSHSSGSEGLQLRWSSSDHLELRSAGCDTARQVNVAHFAHVYGDAVVNDEVIWTICWLDRLCQEHALRVATAAA